MNITVMPGEAIKIGDRIARKLGDAASLTAHFADSGFPPPHPFALLFPRMTAAEQAALTNSIRADGIRDPITVFGNKIADGVSRCLAAIELGFRWEQLRKEQFEGAESALLQCVIDQNLTRRHLNESQRAVIAAQLATLRQGARTDIPDLPQNCGMSQQQAAQRLSVGLRSVQHAVVLLKQGVPELRDAVTNGILPVSAAIKVINLPPTKQREIMAVSVVHAKPAKAFSMEIRSAEVKSRHRQIVANARLHDLGGKRYVILLVDPPWESNESRAGSPFPRLSIGEICQFRLDDGRLVRDALADEAIVYLWILDKYLLELRPILEAWGGLQFHFSMPWPKPSCTLGHRARFQHELCLVCTRGNFPVPEEHLRHSTLIVGPPLNSGDGFHYALPHDDRHSSKPDQLYEMIERAHPDYFGPETVDFPLALELFARNHRPRWDGQGFEYPGRPEPDGAQPKRDELIIVPQDLVTRADLQP